MNDDDPIKGVSELLQETIKDFRASFAKLEKLEDDYLNTLESQGATLRARVIQERHEIAARYLMRRMPTMGDLVRRASQLLEHRADRVGEQIELSMRIAELEAMQEMAHRYASRDLSQFH